MAIQARPVGKPRWQAKSTRGSDRSRSVENNHEALYKAFTKPLLPGNAYCYKELADRGYGRLKEHVQHEVQPFQDATEEEIQRRIRELEGKLGIVREPEVLPPVDESSDPKPN